MEKGCNTYIRGFKGNRKNEAREEGRQKDSLVTDGGRGVNLGRGEL